MKGVTHEKRHVTLGLNQVMLPSWVQFGRPLACVLLLRSHCIASHAMPASAGVMVFMESTACTVSCSSSQIACAARGA